ncbi:MAG: hypothetical protein A3F73_06620 [Gallionellales bacterium RIFCSPLOWO2_12_FULL_59_22]|nr:MAG: hypothetical protein A3H99_11505 [Gallionellales bacterium RIFCSPLOWO2_02_FULL_59_110]OGT13466.1 MAG: hypothetical protein A3F73_06620 [Gallionellales bacterium RIFCSPLOWO2_12_FULL_59_22]
MSAWLIPALKSVLPYAGTIIAAAAPVFTRKSADAAASQAVLMQQQIAELQAAASENDAHIKALAVQMKNTLVALEKEASLAEKRHRRIMLLCISATVVSAASLCVALYIFLAR